MPRHAPKPRRSPLLPFYVVLGLVAVVGAVVLFRQMGGGGGTAATELQQVVLSPEQLQRVPGISQGSPDAPVTVMEFADFQCPGCAQFATFSKPLISDLIENGTVRFVYYDFPLVQIHDHAMLSARAARCANDQDRFWPYHDMLYARQSEWSRAGDATDLFIRYAQERGLDRQAFAECLRSDRYQQEVSESFQLGTTLGVGSTPTVFVNGKKLPQPPQTRAQWDAVIQPELAGAAAAPASAAPSDTAPAAAAPAADTAPAAP